jgi:4'-phosphopantetheinyl transferase EntD
LSGRGFEPATGFARHLAHGQVVAIAVAEPDLAALAELHPDEAALAQTMSPIRKAEWVAGRRALRQALGGIAPATAAIGADDRGAPRVPVGAVGSISHKRALAVALAAPASGWTVGIDLELPAPRKLDIAPRVLTPAELAAIAAHDAAARARAVLLAFALKEAVYKAIDPHLRRYVGFQEVAVWPAAGDTGGDARVAPLAPWGLEVEAAWAEVDGYLVCTARARPA